MSSLVDLSYFSVKTHLNLKMNTLYALVFLLITVSTNSVEICNESHLVSWKADPSDCSVFYLCFGKLEKKYSCPKDTVYNEDGRICVNKGSPEDKCSKTTPLSTEDTCRRSKSLLIPHLESCSKYIDCTTDNVEECYYPFLFDEDTKRCTPPTVASCGERPIPKDPCEYGENQCMSSLGCIPCSVRFPSCRGLPDGLNPWPEREGSPYFVVCQDERVVYQDQCDFENKKEIFHPQKRACLPM